MYLQPPTGPEDTQDLVEELHEVVGWFHLGLCLKVPDYRLQAIRQDHPQDTEMCRATMLSWWWNNSEDRKWAAIVRALTKTGHQVLARKIALKYGMSQELNHHVCMFYCFHEYIIIIGQVFQCLL